MLESCENKHSCENLEYIELLTELLFLFEKSLGEY